MLMLCVVLMMFFCDILVDFLVMLIITADVVIVDEFEESFCALFVFVCWNFIVMLMMYDDVLLMKFYCLFCDVVFNIV